MTLSHKLGTLSPGKAMMIAVLWPAVLLLVSHLLTWALSSWARRPGGDGSHIVLVFDPSGWPILAALLLIPPVVFLVAWRLARR